MTHETTMSESEFTEILVQRTVKLLQCMGKHKPKSREKLIKILQRNSKVVVYCDPLELLNKLEFPVPTLQLYSSIPIVLNLNQVQQKIHQQLKISCARNNQYAVYVGPDDHHWDMILGQVKTALKTVQLSSETITSDNLSHALYQLRNSLTVKVTESVPLLDDIYDTLLKAGFINETGSKNGKTQIRYTMPSAYIVLCMKKVRMNYEEVFRTGHLCFPNRAGSPRMMLSYFIEQVNGQLKEVNNLMASKALLEEGLIDAITALNRSQNIPQSPMEFMTGRPGRRSWSRSRSRSPKRNWRWDSISRSRSSSRSRSPIRSRLRSPPSRRRSSSSFCSSRSNRSRSSSPIRSMSGSQRRSRSPVRMAWPSRLRKSRSRSPTWSRTPSRSRSRSWSPPRRRRSRSSSSEILARTKSRLTYNITQLCKKLLPLSLHTDTQSSTHPLSPTAQSSRQGQGKESCITDVTLDHVLRHLDKLSIDDVTPLPENLTIETIYALECLEKMGSSKPRTKEGIYGILKRQLKFVYYASIGCIVKRDRKLSELILQPCVTQRGGGASGRKRKFNVVNEISGKQDVFLKIGSKVVCKEVKMEREHLLDDGKIKLQTEKQDATSNAIPQKRSRLQLRGRRRDQGGRSSRRKVPPAPEKLVIFGLPEGLKDGNKPSLAILYQNMLNKQVLWRARRQNTIAIKADVRHIQAMKVKLKQLLMNLKSFQDTIKDNECMQEIMDVEDPPVATPNEQNNYKDTIDSEEQGDISMTTPKDNGIKKTLNIPRKLSKAEILATLMKECMRTVTYVPGYLVELLEERGLVQFTESKDSTGKESVGVCYNLDKYENENAP